MPWWTVLAYALVLGTVLAHEVGHLLAFRDAGVPIARLGLGLPLKPMLVIPPGKRRSFALTLSPWLIGAYVTPGGDKPATVLDRLPFRQAAWAEGAGVVMNMIVGCLLFAVVGALDSRWQAVLFVAAAGLLWVIRRSLVFVIVPLGIASAVMLGVWLTSDVRTHQSGGVVGLPAMLTSHDVRYAIGIAAAVSFSLALVNMAPLTPLDGGRMLRSAVLAWKGNKAAEWVTIVSFCGFAVLVVAALGSDVLHLWH
jgi:membrane-associated protease RseP (regulator of RpoE activity)